MGSGYYHQLIEILKKNNCRFVREAKGSHEIWFSPVSAKNFTVAYTVASRHTANAILKQAGLSKEF
ncbi:type II toxin-antitoxin system HicA family toxin [Acinetobacter towneri]|uniref:type II toxin-antitoxin system HicA family toxin n=1 Tax=Acinetobacter towneri TaxID=202956 RepID=UPI001CE1D2B3|nr:type II toxin-antitoxin system HicA family toxin [Acinetobacter towneri]MCA4780484.1 type II toxin-antitoxin system HicA family toxin [Acinetobacter towneri]MCA4785795.1 type II toxin-antitoxin system HicA family toxin [Acinetobacter towneri]MCA4787475.1 type II toxin-antitoxin system HicA family toxin [Acinetobacter towneri]MCA4796945.1 type II toxin-antitoxin system HicA family toxin [Acinetobacter towneri]MCA4802040.1 type II toxin-antitoxin system HicA family toxin [Acinetobacter towner